MASSPESYNSRLNHLAYYINTTSWTSATLEGCSPSPTQQLYWIFDVCRLNNDPSALQSRSRKGEGDTVPSCSAVYHTSSIISV